ncbi:MAG: amino acid transporter [Acidobacteriota bacterium]|nr:amino acid transporter [Acidobacteriota bacterium]
MAENVSELKRQSRLKRWLLQGVQEVEGPYEKEHTHHQQQPWWKVMCLTGVDYFSTLGYQPGIAFLAAGALSPIATLVLVIVTLFGALPMYNRVASESPHGDGSISMLEQLLSRWKGKLFVLALLGFAATGFIVTITLSAADATAHIVENPFVHHTFPFLEKTSSEVILTLLLISGLGAVFLKGFKEAIGIAVVVVAVYIGLNLIVVGTGLYEVFTHPQELYEWKDALMNYPGVSGNPIFMVGLALFVFPKLALGLSGFETGVVVMPLIKSPNRIENTRKLLATAAIIMSFMLIASSIATTVLIPPEEFKAPVMGAGGEIVEPAGKAYGRALAFLAHGYLGEIFGTVYDISTIAILWFAGASALAGLLNIVPRYLPRYGMAPEWARATRPLTIVFILVCFAVTLFFRADVNAQAGVYATGVLALMTSAAIAVTISAWRRNQGVKWAFLVISVVFIFTIVVNIIERPEGLAFASIFIFGIIITSLVSRALRSTEVRIDTIEFDRLAQEFIEDLKKGEIRIVTNRREVGDVAEYRFKEHEKRLDNHIPSGDPIVFYEVDLGDASEFKGKLKIRGVDIDGYRILRTQAPAVPNAIAGLLLYLRDKTGKIPHVYFGWSEGNPAMYLVRYVLFGEGDTAPVTREILRQAEPDPERRPNVHVGG